MSADKEKLLIKRRNFLTKNIIRINTEAENKKAPFMKELIEIDAILLRPPLISQDQLDQMRAFNSN